MRSVERINYYRDDEKFEFKKWKLLTGCGKEIFDSLSDARSLA
ncbi:hypothetical protein [Rhodohalobacter barkolensis]|nr:hypothetical protein [Rhodohalobacter barkolensis]